MKYINSLKIKNKLIAMILLIAIPTLLIAFAAFIWYGNKMLTEALTDEIKTASQVSSNNIILIRTFFQPPSQIEDEFSSLLLIDSIQLCCFYDEMGQLAASKYRPNSIKTKPPSHVLKKEPDIKTIGKYIHLYHPLTDKENNYLGTLYVIASTEKLDENMRDFLYWMLGLIFTLFIIAVLLANRLQGIISRPILSLVIATKEISNRNDYGIRVQKQNNDEIGMLYDEFNLMMDQIQERNIQRDKAKQELKSSQVFLKSVIESMPSLLIAIRRDGTITQWNKSASWISRINSNFALGRNLWELEPDLIGLKDIVGRILKDGKPIEFFKRYINIRSNPFYFNGSIFPLIDGSETTFVIMLNNVTETELKEQQLRQSQKMETVGNLAGGLAHDFNNVLGGIIGTISLFKYKISKKKEITREEIVKYFTTIEVSSNRASDMVKHLLSLTRKHELSFSATDLNDIVKHIVKICANTFDRSIEIETNFFDGSAMTYADPTQVEQSILNLCINSSHAMTIMRKQGESFGGKLCITVKKTIVDKYFKKLHPEAEETEYWDISVSDTGIGIAPINISKIFDPFFTTKSKGTGTGLGLSMVYNIIKQHKGFVSVYSQEGIGATFHVFLKILKDKSSIQELHEFSISPRHGEGLIMVVDDEEVMRLTAKSILEECGYDVILADNGLQAVDIYSKRHSEITAVLLDMVMPKLSGKGAFLEFIKINNNAKVLLTSGFKQDGRVKEILNIKNGRKDFLQKPYTLITLANSLYNLIYSNSPQ